MPLYIMKYYSTPTPDLLYLGNIPLFRLLVN